MRRAADALGWSGAPSLSECSALKAWYPNLRRPKHAAHIQLIAGILALFLLLSGLEAEIAPAMARAMPVIIDAAAMEVVTDCEPG